MRGLVWSFYARMVCYFHAGMMCDFHPRRRILMWKIVQNFHAGTVWYFHAVNGVEFSCRKWGSIFMWEIVQNFHVGKWCGIFRYEMVSMVSFLSTLSIRRSKQAMHLMLCLSTLSTLVFVALTQHLMQVWKLCIKWPLAPARREGYCVSLPSWGFSCSPVSLRRQLCKLSWTCQTKRVIAGKMHSQSPILKTKGRLATQ